MELPYEVLVHLFKFLPKSDRKAASETCQSWYMAANDYCFLKKKVVIFFKTTLNDEDSSPHYIFENASLPYYNFLFSEVEITNKTNSFWNKIGENVNSLAFRNCDICEKSFIYVLKKCSNLKTLNVQNCKELFMSGRLLEGETEGFATNSLDKLKSLSLAGNQYLTDALFNRFVKAAPILEELDLSACSLQFHYGLIKRFYPPDVDIFQYPSESVLTFYFISQFIMSRAKNIKRLLFSKTLIDGSALKQLSETENLRLESLRVHSCDQLTNSGFSALATHQTSLKELDVGLCTRVTDQTLVHFCKNLLNLEQLNIQRCRAVTDIGIGELHKLKKLKCLNISQCELVSKVGLQWGLCNEVNTVLEELDLNSLNLDQGILTMMSEKLPNLRSIDLSYCFNAVTDTSIQLIFKNQVLLHTLKISHCDKVSDAGLTGMGTIETGDVCGPVMSSLDDSLISLKIHLGSRAEGEIVRDAKRKLHVMNMCETLSLDSYTGYSLAGLKCLRELDMSGCNKITDVSLMYAFACKELKNLNLSRCQQITHVGIEHLVKNCPSIEILFLKDCFNLKDEAIIAIAEGLRRLQYLELRGCSQLSDVSLHAIQNHCEKLKFLDIQGCKQMSTDLTCALGALPTLHTVLVNIPHPLKIDGIKSKPRPPKFLSTILRKLRLN